MAASVVQVAPSRVVTSGDPLACTFAVAPTAGNFVVALLNSNSDAASLPAAASGWTKVAGTVNAAFLGGGYYYKLMSGSPSTTQTCASGSNFADCLTMFEVTGLSDMTTFANNVDAYVGHDYGSTSDYATDNPNGTASVNGIVLFQSAVRDNGGAAVAPTAISNLGTSPTSVTGVASGSRAVHAWYNSYVTSDVMSPDPTFDASTDQCAANLLMLKGGVTDTVELLAAAGIVATSNALTDLETFVEALDAAGIVATSYGLVDYAIFAEALDAAGIVVTGEALSEGATSYENLDAAGIIVTSEPVGSFQVYQDALNAAGIVATAYAVGSQLVFIEFPDASGILLTSQALGETINKDDPRFNVHAPTVYDPARTEQPVLTTVREALPKLAK